MEAKFTLTLNLGNGEEQLAFQEKKIIKGLGKATLISLNLKKEIYTPAHIEAVLQIEVDGNISSFDKMNYKSLLGKTVNLSDGKKELAKDYIIFDYVPEYKPSENGTSLYLTLNIYSPEKVLDYQKYNKCYVAKKLAAQVFKEIASKHSKEIKSTNIDNLQHILIKNTATNIATEFIQPYLVQYEETALDFLTRSANRCGEFMFFENGTWQLGFKPGDPITVEKFSSLTFKEFNEGEEENYYTTNYLKSDSEQKTLNQQKATRSFQGPKQEYLDVLIEGQSEYNQAVIKAYDFKDPANYISTMSDWLKKDNATAIISSIIYDVTTNVCKIRIKHKETEASWTKNFILPYAANTEQSSVVNGKKVVSQFSNYNACNFFEETFYTNIKKMETLADTQAIHIDFGTYYQPLLLGDVIKVLGNEYVIVRISATCKQNTSVERAGQYTTYAIDAVPKVKDMFYPPRVKKQPTKAVTQTAFVSANNDPCNLGRIQIRYPWQPKESGPASPWIRVSQGFASKDAGIKFIPQVGDEIMVGYEFGEIERPFMMGALASKERKLSYGEDRTAYLEDSVKNGATHSFFNNDFVIKSLNGHYLKFLAPNSQSVLSTSFFPAVSAWLGYLPMAWDVVKYAGNTSRQLSGGIKMGDGYGFVKFQMSTDDRKITISSTLGDVKIDAFTGITISAPNGNVKIEGKNIDIIAGNNLTLKSGENVKKMKAYSKNFGHALMANVAKDGVEKVKSLVQPFDIKLLRTVIDSFVKPIGGTMLVKSTRFMRLEAGSGETQLPYAAYKKESKTRQSLVDGKLTEFKVQDTLKSTVNLMNSWSEFFKSEKENLAYYKRKYASNLRTLAEWINAGNMMTNLNCKLNGEEIKETDNQLVEKLEKELPTADDIVKMAEDPNAKPEKAHEKLDKLTYPSTFASFVDAAHQNLKDSSEELFTIAKSNQTKSIDKDKAIEASLTYSDLNFVADVVDNEAYKKDVKDCITEVCDSILTEMKKDQDPNVTKRKILYKVLQKLKDKKYISIENEEGIVNLLTLDHERNKVKLDESACNDTETWEKYLDCVKAYEEKASLWKQVGQFFLKNTEGNMADGWAENNIYHPEIEGGEILFSDTDGNTRNIKGDLITKVPVSPIKNMIEKLKKI